MKLGIKVFISSILIAFIMVGCSSNKQYEEIRDKNKDLQQQNDVIKDEEGNVITDEYGEVAYEGQALYAKQEKIRTVNKDIILDGLTFTVKEIEETKKLHDINSSEIINLGENINQEGNIIDDKTFVYISLEITNNQNEEKEFCLGSICITELDENNMIEKISDELRYMNPKIYKDNRMHTYKFKPGECTNFNLIYIINDDSLEKKLYVCINNGDYTEGFHVEFQGGNGE